MGVFDEVLQAGESLFKNEVALDFNFLPKLIPYREKEQTYVASCIRPLLVDRNGRNVLVHGPPGVGKTAAVRHLLKELEESDEYGEEIDLFYVNCWQKNTTYKIMLELCDYIGYAFTQNKKTDELFRIIANRVNKKKAVFVFDEIDKADDVDFLYSIVEDIYKKTLILITNYKSWLLELDDRIKSRLMLELLEFGQYNLIETEGILKQRMGYAFQKGVFEDSAIKLIAKKSHEVKDIRSGLFLMREAALLAEEKARRKVLMDQVRQAIQKLEDFTIKNSAELLEDEKAILKVVKQHPGKRIGDLYKLYQKTGGKVSYKTFQRKLAKLDEDRFISLERTHKGGNTTIVHKKITEF